MEAQATADGGTRYICYLVPEGKVYTLLERYYEDTLAVYRNEAHDYLPHCSLTGFFKLPDGYPLQRLISPLQRVLTDAEERLTCRPTGQSLAWVKGLYDDSAIGLAVRAPEIVSTVTSWANEVKEESKGAVVIAPKTRLHISMAYGAGVERNQTPLLFSRALELDAERRALELHEKTKWQVVLLQQKPREKGKPRLWMTDALWTRHLE